MIDDNNDFKKLALSHYGYDGGNLKSSLWISGLEWGVGITPERLSEDIQKGELSKPLCWDKFEDRENYLKVSFDRVWMKIFINALGHETKEYRNIIKDPYNALASNGIAMKFNLYPIAFKNTASSNWSWDFYRCTGFPTKELYIAWVQKNRFLFFNDLVKEYNPKIILCSGISYYKDYLMAFGGIEALFSEPEDIVTIAGNKQMFVYASKLSRQARICIVPFFGGISGIKSDEECRIIGNYIRSGILEKLS